VLRSLPLCRQFRMAYQGWWATHRKAVAHTSSCVAFLRPPWVRAAAPVPDWGCAGGSHGLSNTNLPALPKSEKVSRARGAPHPVVPRGHHPPPPRRARTGSSILYTMAWGHWAVLVLTACIAGRCTSAPAPWPTSPSGPSGAGSPWDATCTGATGWGRVLDRYLSHWDVVTMVVWSADATQTLPGRGQALAGEDLALAAALRSLALCAAPLALNLYVSSTRATSMMGAHPLTSDLCINYLVCHLVEADGRRVAVGVHSLTRGVMGLLQSPLPGVLRSGRYGLTVDCTEGWFSLHSGCTGTGTGSEGDGDGAGRGSRWPESGVGSRARAYQARLGTAAKHRVTWITEVPRAPRPGVPPVQVRAPTAWVHQVYSRLHL
jgi:hypothetical protein